MSTKKVKGAKGKYNIVHGLRHSLATHMLENGTDLLYIQSLPGVPRKIWFSNGKLFGEFRETVWVDAKRHEKIVSFEIPDNFKDIDSFYNLDTESLNVPIYKWDGKVWTIEHK